MLDLAGQWINISKAMHGSAIWNLEKKERLRMDVKVLKSCTYIYSIESDYKTRPSLVWTCVNFGRVSTILCVFLFCLCQFGFYEFKRVYY
jgi:hypothetical protein